MTAIPQSAAHVENPPSEGEPPFARHLTITRQIGPGRSLLIRSEGGVIRVAYRGGRAFVYAPQAIIEIIPQAASRCATCSIVTTPDALVEPEDDPVDADADAEVLSDRYDEQA